MTDVMQTKPNRFLGCHAAPSDKILQCGTLNERTDDYFSLFARCGLGMPLLQVNSIDLLSLFNFNY